MSAKFVHEQTVKNRNICNEYRKSHTKTINNQTKDKNEVKKPNSIEKKKKKKIKSCKQEKKCGRTNNRNKGKS